MKIKNTPSRNKIIRFADAFIEVPVKSEWIVVNRVGSVFAMERAPVTDVYGDVFAANLQPVEQTYEATLVAIVEDFGGAQVIKIEDLMAGL